MTRQIRQQAFETNSSSSHSVTIAPGNYVSDTLYVDDSGVCEIYPGEYGWEAEDYHSASEKASYALTWAKSLTEGSADARNAEEMLIKVIKAETGAREVRLVPNFTAETKTERDYWEWGYVDHQSGPGSGSDFAKVWKSEALLHSFIFNPASFVHTDNDNSPCSRCEETRVW